MSSRAYSRHTLHLKYVAANDELSPLAEARLISKVVQGERM